LALVMGCFEVGETPMNSDWRRLIPKSGFVKIVHRTITVEMFNRERVMLIIAPNAMLWLRRVVL
jgi:hypothetical protein